MIGVPARQIMTSDAEWIGPHASVQAAASLMEARNIGFLVIYDAPIGVVGVVTDRDIALRSAATGRDPVTTEVREIMTTDVASCRDSDDVESAAHHMKTRGVRRLVVVDDHDQLVGVVSVDDVSRTVGADWLTGFVVRHTAAEPTR